MIYFVAIIYYFLLDSVIRKPALSPVEAHAVTLVGSKAVVSVEVWVNFQKKKLLRKSVYMGLFGGFVFSLIGGLSRYGLPPSNFLVYGLVGFLFSLLYFYYTSLGLLNLLVLRKGFWVRTLSLFSVFLYVLVVSIVL